MEPKDKQNTTGNPQSGHAAGQDGNDNLSNQNPNASQHTQNQQQGNSVQFHDREHESEANLNRDPDGSGETRAGQQPGSERPA